MLGLPGWNTAVALALATAVIVLSGAAAAADATTTKLVVKPGTAVHGQMVRLDAGVRLAGTTTRVTGGTVEFERGGTVLGSAVVADGKAGLVVEAPALGVAPVVAHYRGTDAYGPSDSAPVRLQVESAATRTTLSLPATWFHTGYPINATATVTAVAPSRAVPVGSVRFLLEGRDVGVGTIDAGGRATVTFTVAEPSERPLTAVYEPTAGSGFRITAAARVRLLVRYAIGPEVVVDTGPGLQHAPIKLGRAAALFWTRPVEGGRTELKFCAYGPSTALAACRGRVVTTFATADFQGLVASAAEVPGARWGDHAVVAGTLPGEDGRRRIWLGYVSPTGELIAATELSAPGLDLLHPVLAYLLDGRFVLAYADGEAIDDLTVRARIFAPGVAGFAEIGEPIVVASRTWATFGLAVAPDFAPADRGFTVGWIAGITARPTIRRFRSDGQPLGEERWFGERPWLRYPSLQIDLEALPSPLSTIVTWATEVPRGPGPTNLRQTRCVAVTDCNGAQFIVRGANEFGAQIDASAEWAKGLEGWLTVFTSPDRDGAGVYGKLRRWPNWGWEEHFPLAETTAGDQHAPKAVAPIVGRDFLVFWLQEDADGEAALIGRRYRP